MPICCWFIAICWQGEFDRYLVLTGKVGIRDLRIWYFEGRSILNIESKFSLPEFALSPVPTS